MFKNTRLKSETKVLHVVHAQFRMYPGQITIISFLKIISQWLWLLNSGATWTKDCVNTFGFILVWSGLMLTCSSVLVFFHLNTSEKVVSTLYLATVGTLFPWSTAKTIKQWIIFYFCTSYKMFKNDFAWLFCRNPTQSYWLCCCRCGIWGRISWSTTCTDTVTQWLGSAWAPRGHTFSQTPWITQVLSDMFGS